MVKSNTTSITPATHAARHLHGGADPLTGDVRIDDIGQAQAAAAEIYNANSPTAWTNLDLSATIGAKKALVILEVFNNDATNPNYYGFRPGGNTNEHGTITGSFSAANKLCLDDSASLREAGIVMCVTDANGILQWKACGVAYATIINLLGYILLA